MQNKLINFDWAIKRILRSKANFEILEGFLSELLLDDIKIIEIIESQSNKNTQDYKSNQVDIKVKNSKDEIIIVQIQCSREMDYMERIFYSRNNAITEHISQRSDYSDIPKVISINILYFDFGEGDDYIYKGNTNFEGIHTHTKLYLNEVQKDLYKTNEINKIYPEYYLIKVKNFDDIAKNTLDEWINFLKNETIPDNPKDKGLKKAKETLDYLNMSDSEKTEYDKREENLRREASIYEGTYIAGGIEAVKLRNIEIAKSLYKNNVSLEVIKLSTGLSDEDLKRILE